MHRLTCIGSSVAAHRLGSSTHSCVGRRRRATTSSTTTTTTWTTKRRRRRSPERQCPCRHRLLVGEFRPFGTTAAFCDGPLAVRTARDSFVGCGFPVPTWAAAGRAHFRTPPIYDRARSFSSSSPATRPQTEEVIKPNGSENAEGPSTTLEGNRSALEKRRRALLEGRRKLQKRMERDALQQQIRASTLENMTYRSQKEFDALFHQIAPRVPITKIRDSLRTLKAVLRQSERQLAGDGSVLGPDNASVGGSFADRLFDLYHKTPPDDRALKLTLAFLLTESVKDDAADASVAAPGANVVPLPMESGVTVLTTGGMTTTAVGPSAAKHPYMVELLLEARKRAWKEALAWDYSKRPEAQIAADGPDGIFGEHDARREAEVVVSRLLSHLPTKKRNSLLDLLEAYTGMNEKKYAAAPSVTAMAPSSTKGKSQPAEKSSSTDVPKRLNILSLSSQLKNRLRSHYHLVAPHIATFLGYNVEETVEKDVAYVTSHEKWRLYREEFTTALMALQDGLLRDAIAHDPVLMQQYRAHQQLLQHSVDDDLHPSEPTTSPVLTHRRVRRPIHAVMDALYIHETTNPIVPLTFEDGSSSGPPPLEGLPNSDSADNVLHAPVETTVFLDNLPIDITPEEVKELYRRCGDISSVRVYNQRPELDPGPLSHAQLMARKRGSSLTSSRFRKWQRPRSPAYAMVAFETTKGYETCVSDSLRIFGMLIQKHPVRSIRASDMTTLYLEGIRAGTSPTGAADEAFVDDGIPSLDLEYQLREHLGPDVFVCLDARQYNRAMVGSCEIRFPSFDAARECFVKLQDLPIVRDDPGCSVQWMRTPNDAMDWWTRKRGFD